MKRTHRFALTVSGGIALGSYEAGALSQLYRDLHAFNHISELRDKAGLFIDAIGGASAGSVTGLILAQAVGLGLPPDTLEERMRACWVELLSIENLLAAPPREDKGEDAKAIFTGAVIESVIQKSLEIPPHLVGDPGTVALWITATNLDGIPQVIDFAREGHAQASTALYALDYKDYLPFVINGATIESPGNRMALAEDASQSDLWEAAAEAARASGAFPVAFPGRRQERNLTSYPEYVKFREDVESERLANTAEEAALKPRGDRALPDTAMFQFVDGGIFNNEPIGHCIDAVTFLEQKHPEWSPSDPENKTGRSFVIIEPDPQLPEAIEDALFVAQRPRGDASLPTAVLGKILSAYFNSALFGDFQTAAETNQKIRALNEALSALDGVGLPEETVKKLKDDILKAAGLEDKREITLQRIPHELSSGNRLAGAFAGHFGGFLRKDYREADFITGRFEARLWLTEWLKRWLNDHTEDVGLTADKITTEYVISLLGAAPPDPRMIPIPPTDLFPTQLAHSGWFPEHRGDNGTVLPADKLAALTEEQRTAILNLIEQRGQTLLESWLDLSPLVVRPASFLLAHLFNHRFTTEPGK